jgi:hypothetical protein
MSNIFLKINPPGKSRTGLFLKVEYRLAVRDTVAVRIAGNVPVDKDIVD